MNIFSRRPRLATALASLNKIIDDLGTVAADAAAEELAASDRVKAAVAEREEAALTRTQANLAATNIRKLLGD